MKTKTKKRKTGKAVYKAGLRKVKVQKKKMQKVSSHLNAARRLLKGKAMRGLSIPDFKEDLHELQVGAKDAITSISAQKATLTRIANDKD